MYITTTTSFEVVGKGGLFCYVISCELSQAEGKGSRSSKLVGKCVFISKRSGPGNMRFQLSQLCVSAVVLTE